MTKTVLKYHPGSQLDNPLPSLYNTPMKLRIFIIAALFTLVGCTAEDIPFVYKIDIPQGNIITDEELERLEVGMTPQQVTFLLGTPLLVDPFHQDQWDYIYMFTPGSTKSWDGETEEEQLLRVYFKNGVVEKFSFIEKHEAED